MASPRLASDEHSAEMGSENWLRIGDCCEMVGVLDCEGVKIIYGRDSAVPYSRRFPP